MSKKQEITCLAFDKRGRLISVGTNSYNRTHRIQYKYASKVGNPDAIYLHAEIDALIRARGKRIHKVFISRQLGNGEKGMAKPCKICQLALKDYGVEVVEWTTGGKQ